MKEFLFAFSAEGEEQLKILFLSHSLSFYCSFTVHALSINNFSIMLIFFVKYILQNERLSNTSKVPNDFIGIFDVIETFLAIPQINEV